MNCSNFHRVTSVEVTTTQVVLVVTDATNIGNLERFNLICRKPVSSLVTTAPLPVYVAVNGTNIPIKNAFGLPLMSNVVPYGLTMGRYVVEATPGETGDTTTPYVILNTPCYA